MHDTSGIFHVSVKFNQKIHDSKKATQEATNICKL